MSFRSIVRDVRDGFGSLSRRRFETVLPGHNKDRSPTSAQEPDGKGLIEQNSCWASLPLELLRDVIKRLEESESSWPSRRNVVTCASVCRAWRQTCKEIVAAPEFSGRITFPSSLKQPGSRNGHIQCFIRRDDLRSTYHLYLCLNPGRGLYGVTYWVYCSGGVSGRMHANKIPMWPSTISTGLV